jgi:long-chain fatty acid transport protein
LIRRAIVIPDRIPVGGAQTSGFARLWAKLTRRPGGLRSNARHSPFRGLLLLIAGSFVSSAMANGFRVADQDAFAAARGEAFVATADNASAVFYNPAGMAQLSGNNLRAGIYGIYADPTFEPPGTSSKSGETFHMKDRYAAVPQFFYTYTPASLPVSIGLGVYSPFGGSIEWPDDTGFRSVATKGSLLYEKINLALAVKLVPGLSIGAGVSADFAELQLEQGLLNVARPLTNFFRFNARGWSASYDLGVLWKPHEMISFGAVYRSATTIAMDGHTEFMMQPIIKDTSRYAQADVKFPLNATFGVSIRPTSKWNIEFDADYTDWSCFKTIDITQARPLPFPIKANVPVTLRWNSSWMYEFGVTRYFDHGWHVSAGYLFNQSSVPDDFYTPVAADLDRHFFSLGAGYAGKRFSFDLAYQAGYGPPRTVSNSEPSSQPAYFSGERADGTYGFTSHALMVTVGVHF